MEKNITTRQRIIEYITSHQQATAKELADFLDISRQALFKHHLTPLVQAGVLVKLGKPPF